jgi:hypothetical protein
MSRPYEEEAIDSPRVSRSYWAAYNHQLAAARAALRSLSLVYLGGRLAFLRGMASRMYETKEDVKNTNKNYKEY